MTDLGRALLAWEEHRVLLAAEGIDLRGIIATLPHAKAEMNVHVSAEPPTPDNLDLRVKRLTEQHRRREAGIVDAHAMSAPACGNDPFAPYADHASLPGERYDQLTGQMMRPPRRHPLRRDARIVQRDRFLKYARRFILGNQCVE